MKTISTITAMLLLCIVTASAQKDFSPSLESLHTTMFGLKWGSTEAQVKKVMKTKGFTFNKVSDNLIYFRGNGKTFVKLPIDRVIAFMEGDRLAGFAVILKEESYDADEYRQMKYATLMAWAMSAPSTFGEEVAELSDPDTDYSDGIETTLTWSDLEVSLGVNDPDIPNARVVVHRLTE